MEKISIEDIKHLYGIDAWGKDYFGVNAQGHLTIQTKDDQPSDVDIFEVVESIRSQGRGAPLLLRFPQLLGRRLKKLTHAFKSSISEFQYSSQYQPVFPIKVNQTQHVVHEILKYGRNTHLGIEAGSKPELLIALGQSLSPQALTICNGFKDQDYMNLASIGTDMGKNVVMVIEKPFELKLVQTLIDQKKTIPKLGFRIKLQAKGSGLWEKSGGYSSKFGLTSMQLLEAMDWLKKHGLLDRLALLHFHIGSQITEIRKIKAAIREAARVYAKIQKTGAHIDYLDVGGGLGVDHDGSKTSSDASVNYTVEEYANDVVYTIKEVCDEEKVPHPIIVSESGRALVTHHALLVVDAREVIQEGQTTLKFDQKTHKQSAIEDLVYIYDHINVKNFRESYHDAVEKRDEAQSFFNLGLLTLEDRAYGETLYYKISQKALRYAQTAKFVADEFVTLEKNLVQKLVCNFSVFESVPDHWALNQLFPIVPLHMLDQKPTNKATLVDITCDSDGEIEKFVDLKDIKEALEVHEFDSDKPYYLGILMVGAYQDTMGNPHNLFGKVHEAHVYFDDEVKIESVTAGQTCGDTIEIMGYDIPDLITSISEQCKESQASTPEHIESLTNMFSQYTYLTRTKTS